jgi:hypothetical protein
MRGAASAGLLDAVLPAAAEFFASAASSDAAESSELDSSLTTEFLGSKLGFAAGGVLTGAADVEGAGRALLGFGICGAATGAGVVVSGLTGF